MTQTTSRTNSLEIAMTSYRKTTSYRKIFAAGIVSASVLGLSACTEEIHSAQWWMGHGPELQAKLTECKKYPSLNESDQNCKNATEAFMTLVTVTAQKAQESQPQPAPAESN